jgi:hypothetical protein
MLGQLEWLKLKQCSTFRDIRAGIADFCTSYIDERISEQSRSADGRLWG